MNLSTLGKDAKHVLGTLAPLIGTAIGGPFGTIAGSLLDEFLGTSGDSTAANAKLANLTSADAAKVQQAELAFKTQLAQMKVTEDQLRFTDVSNARKMQDDTKSSTPTVLSYFVVIATAVAFAGILSGKFPVPASRTEATSR